MAKNVVSFPYHQSLTWSPQDSGWSNAFSQLEKLAKLTDNWDGEGATSPRSDILSSVKQWLFSKFAQSELPPSRILAAQDGAVVIRWSGAEPVEYEFNTPNKAEWLKYMPNDEVIGGELEIPYRVHRTLTPTFVLDQLLLPSYLTWEDYDPIALQEDVEDVGGVPDTSIIWYCYGSGEATKPIGLGTKTQLPTSNTDVSSSSVDHYALAS